jgi:hypothetical protein
MTFFLPSRNAATFSSNACAVEAGLHGKENDISRLEKRILQATAGLFFCHHDHRIKTT